MVSPSDSIKGGLSKLDSMPAMEKMEDTNSMMFQVTGHKTFNQKRAKRIEIRCESLQGTK